MKSNQRTIKVYDATHKTLSKLSATYGISMSAIVDALAFKMASDPTIHLEIPPKDKRYAKVNARRIVKANAK